MREEVDWTLLKVEICDFKPRADAGFSVQCMGRPCPGKGGGGLTWLHN